MGYWKFVVPAATTNYALNPIWHLDSGYTAEAGTTVNQVATYTKWGGYSLYIEGNADNEGVEIDLDSSGLANAAHYVTMAVQITSLTSDWDWSLDDVDYKTPTEIMALDGDWSLYGTSFTAGQSNGSTTLHIHQDGAGAMEVHIDGVQVEQGTTWTTLCYGGAEGCEWNGPAHASTSTRSAQSRAGGYLYDFEDDYNFHIVDWQGWGVPPHTLDLASYETLPGGTLNGVKVNANLLTLTGYFAGSSLANLHSLRQALVEELAHDRYPETDNGWQPIRIWYTGAAVVKEAKCFYDSGLEGSGMVGRGFTETMPVRFLMADPFWYEIGDSSDYLDSNNSDVLRYLAQRSKATGTWNPLGLSNNPTANGTIYAVLVASDGSVYFGGDFDGLDNNSPAGSDYIVRYDPETEDFNLLVGASDVNNDVRCIAEGPDGTIYLGGDFTAVNGVASADYIVSYDPSADTWSSLGDPDSGGTMARVWDMAFDSSGNLYIVGQFTGVAGVANTEYIAYWDGTNWNSAGDVNTGAAAITSIRAIAIDSQDNIYVGGDFTNLADDANADYWGWLENGGSWAAVDDIALNALVNGLTFNENDELFVSGSFTNADSVSDADYIFKWTGTAVEALGSPPNATGWRTSITPDGQVWFSGAFTTIGGISVVDRVAIWNGSSWIPPDLNLSGTPAVYTIDFGPADPVVPSSYDVYLGFDTTGTSYYSGITTVTYDGTTTQYPIITFNRSGGTSARIVSVRNWTTGQDLYLDYDLLDGETLIIDCRPEYKQVSSSFAKKGMGFGGSPSTLYIPGRLRPDAILPNSDFGTFRLQPGDNRISAFVDIAGAPTILMFMLWRDAYRGMD